MCLIYQKLNDREIRLVRVLTTTKEDVHCELRAFSLDYAHHYLALSYRWTETEAKCCIYINGVQSFVRQNLLAYLELAQDKGNEAWIFIDAICINQSDILERNQQVVLMGEVYRGADEVIGWVGTDGPHDEDLEIILQNACNSSTGIDTLFEKSKHQDLVEDALQKYMVNAFLRPEYWSRVWIVQETLLASNLSFRYRTLTISSDCLAYFVKRWLEQHKSTDSKFKSNKELLPNFTGAKIGREVVNSRYMFAFAGTTSLQSRDLVNLIGLLLAERRFKLRDELPGVRDLKQRMSFTRAIILGSAHDSTHRHDKVFGLLGLTGAFLKVDYAMPISELYLRTLLEGLLDPGIDETSNTQKYGSFSEDELDLIGNLEFSDIAAFFLALQDSLGLNIWHPTVWYISKKALEHTGRGGIYAYLLLMNVQLFTITRPFHELLSIVPRLLALGSVYACWIPLVVASVCMSLGMAVIEALGNVPLPACDNLSWRPCSRLTQDVKRVFIDVMIGVKGGF